MFCPESLAVAGNAAGQVGWPVFPALMLIALCFAGCADLLSNPNLPDASSGNTLLFCNTGDTVSEIGKGSLTIAACLPLAVLGATALPVTAGYTFNEVFLYWFPNFAFAFLILFLLTFLQFFPTRIALRAQACFTGLAAGGLLLLGFYGTVAVLSPWAEKSIVSPVTAHTSSLFSHSSVLLFLVFSCSFFPGQKQGARLSVLIPIAGFLVFLFWMTASLGHVAPGRLASSIVPYMTAARKIMGETGRFIMGAVIICGSCGAVNGLMLLSRRMLAEAAVEQTGISVRSAEKKIKLLLPAAVAVNAGILMATGLAGEEVLLRSALILWLIQHIARCCSALVRLRAKTGRLHLPALCGTVFSVVGLLVLISGDPEKIQIIVFIFTGLGIGGLLTAACRFFYNKRTRKEKAV